MNCLAEAATIGGLAFGGWAGLALESRYVRFSVAGPFWQRALRYLIGCAGILAIWMGPGILPQVTPAFEIALQMARSGAVMLWTIMGWPWLFVRIGLGAREGG